MRGIRLDPDQKRMPRLHPFLHGRIHSLAGSTGDYMPLVRISLLAGKPESHKRKVSDAVHRALVETIAIPAQDRFHIITEHTKPDFIYDPHYLNISRTDDLVIIQIAMSAGRTLEVRKSLYRRVADLLNQE